MALLTVGSQAEPKEALASGDEGTRQLVQLKKMGEEKGLSALFQTEDDGGRRRLQRVKSVLGKDGLPPLPCPTGRAAKAYRFSEEKAYPDG